MLSQPHLCHPQALSLFSVNTHACKDSGVNIALYGADGRIVPDVTYITIEEHGFMCAADGVNKLLVEFVPATPAGSGADGEPGAAIAADTHEPPANLSRNLYTLSSLMSCLELPCADMHPNDLVTLALSTALLV